MKNVIIISGLGGSGKTYLGNQIMNSELKSLFKIESRGPTQENYKQIIEEVGNEDTLLILEMHPPFDKLDVELTGVNLLHVAISKDYKTYVKEISKEKIEYLNNWFIEHKSPNIITDIIAYNQARFDYGNQMPKNSVIVSSIMSGYDRVYKFCQNIRKTELFKFAHKNYDTMLYHSPDFNGIGYEGTAPSNEKFELLKLPELLHVHGDKGKKTCLDVGCNIGYISYLLSEYFEVVDGIDINEKNIDCANWIKQKFFRDKNIIFNQVDFMKTNLQHDFIFALAVLHHIMKVHKPNEVFEKLGDLTKVAAVIEINEMPDWDITRIKQQLTDYFKEVKVIGNSLLPCSKKLVNNRWIIHCIK